MTATDTQFVTDDAGERIAVLVGIDRYRMLLDAADEVDALRAYDAAKASGDESLAFEDAIREIEQDRRAS